MNTYKILIPQELPSIFEKARAEKNWLIFAIGKPDENGKRAKRPVVRDRPYIWTNRDKAACFTFERARARLQEFAEWPGDINEKVAQRRAQMIEEGKKPGPEIEVEGYALGYFPREDSALVALDFDNVVQDGAIMDFELGAAIEESGAYVEISSSGSGLRVFMPREKGDERYHRGEKNDVGLFVSQKGAGCALTFNTVRDGDERDQALFDLVIERHGAGERHEERDAGDIDDQVLSHGRVEVDTFLEMVALVPNDNRFDGFDEWLAMVRGAKEYYEAVDPDRLDEVRDAIEAWCDKWPGGHDPDRFEEVWNRKPRAGSKAGLGSWVHHAKEAGWDWPQDRTEREPWHQFPRPPAKMETVEDFQARFVLIGGRFYDRLMRRDVESVDALGNHISAVDWPKPKDKRQANNAAYRHDQARKKVQRFTAGVFAPGRPECIEDVIVDAAGHETPAPGARLYNLWTPPRIEEGGPVPTTWIEHVRRLYPDEAEIIFDWLALKVQTNKIGFALVLGGTPGAGKDLLLQPIVQALSPHAAGSVDIRQMDGDFSGDVIAEKTLVVVQEARGGSGARDLREREASLRTMIAVGEPYVVNRKGRPQVAIPNVADFVFTMNEVDGLHIPVDDRRYCVAYTGAEAMTAEDYDRYKTGFEGCAAVVSWLHKRRTKLAPGMPAPMTEAKRSTQKTSLSKAARDIAPAVDRLIEGKAWVAAQWIAGEVWNEWEGPPDTLPTEIGNILATRGWKHAPHWRGGRVEIGGDKLKIWIAPATGGGVSEGVSKSEIIASLKAGEDFGAKIRLIRHPSDTLRQGGGVSEKIE